ncbi:MAG: hypothetical protein C0490_20300 [Marivirga sp.]|nr:hypothetical protein [Marivirga sp.]
MFVWLKIDNRIPAPHESVRLEKAKRRYSLSEQITHQLRRLFSNGSAAYGILPVRFSGSKSSS